MGNRYPNGSLLSILTVADVKDKTEELLFAHVMVIPDFFDPEMPIYWMMKKDHNVLYTCSDERIYQYVAKGESAKIEDLFEKFMTDGILEIQKKPRHITIPPNEDNGPEEWNPHDGYQSISYRLNNASTFSEKFKGEELLSAISGFSQYYGVDKHICPPGLYEKGYLYKNLCKGIVAVKECRTPVVLFHGVRPEKGFHDNVCKKLIGFVQKNNRTSSETISISTTGDGAKDDETTIDSTSGLFELTSQNPIANGTLYYTDDCNNSRNHKFSLIMNFKIDAEIVNTEFKDLFGKVNWLHSTPPQRPKQFENTSWFSKSYPNEKEAASKLSDIMTGVLSTLEKDIIIVDPYYLGSIERDTQNKIQLTKAQLALINSLITIKALYGLDSVTFVGNSRITNLKDSGNGSGDKIKSTSDTTAFDNCMTDYQNFWNDIFNSKIFQTIGKWKVSFRRSNSDFHNRYWLSGDGSNITATGGAVVSNSISGMEETDFCNLIPDKYRSSIHTRYGEILKNSSEIFTI